MFNKLIDVEPGKVFGLLITKGYDRNMYLNKLIEDLNASNDVMLWQQDEWYFDCKRVNLCFNSNLDEMWETYVNNFKVLIISFFADWANTREITNFMLKLKQDERAKDKTIIIIFKAKTHAEQLKIEDFNNLADVILSNCDEIYMCNRYTNFETFIIESLFSEEKTLWKRVERQWLEYSLEEFKEDE